MKKVIAISIFAMVVGLTPVTSHSKERVTSKKPVIFIILGSTRLGRFSEKVGAAIKLIADTRSDIVTEIIDLIDYNIPFFGDEIAPASREKIFDHQVKKWSEKIQEADGFIIALPEYNAGYPGVLKNALDSLYKEWNNKPVGFVGYSGGPSGGTSAIAQLRQVVRVLRMKAVSQAITIPTVWKAFNAQGDLIGRNIKKDLYCIIDQIISLIN